MRLATEVQDAESLRQRLEVRESELLAERRKVAKSLKAEMEGFRREVQGQLRKEVERMKLELDKGRRKGVAGEAVGRLFESAPKLDVEEAEEELPLIVGKAVKHRRLGWTGVLEKLEKGRAQVLMQGKSVLCKEKELMGARDGAGPAKKERNSAPKLASQARVANAPGNAPADLHPESELFLVGQRVEPALKRLDRFLDKSLLASVGAVRIIHGHGSGRLRNAVREHLKGHPAVSTHRPGKANEGGDGATVVALAG